MSSQSTFEADPYCFDCHKSFGRVNEMNRHFRITLVHNSDARQHPCHICHKRFTQKSNIRQHLRAVHKIGIEDKLSDEPPSRRRRNPRAKAQRGKRLARKNARREGSSLFGSPSIPSIQVVEPTPSVQGSPLDTKPLLSSVITADEISNLGGESLFFDGPLDNPNYSPVSEAAPSIPPCYFDPSGSVSSTPMMNPSPSSLDDAQELNEIENEVKFFFAGQGSPFSNSSSFDGPRVNVAQDSLYSTQMYNNNVNGPVVPGQLQAYHDIQVPPSISSFNNQLLLSLIDDVSQKRNYFQQQYQEQQYQQQQYQQQQYQQYQQQQYYQQQQQQQQQQQYGQVGDMIEDLLSPDFFAACSEIIHMDHKSYGQQQVPWLSNLSDDFAHLTIGVSY